MLGLTALSLVLFLIATYLLSSQRYVWDAFLLLFLSGIGLVASFARDASLRKSTVVRWGSLFPRTTAGWVRLGGLGIAVAVAFAARTRSIMGDFTGLFLWWLLAVLSFTMTLVLPLIRRKRLAEFASKEMYGLAVLLLVAFLVRVVALGGIPANLGGDEGAQMLDGLRLVQRPMGNPFATGWYSVPTMSFLAYGVSMRLFGATMAGGRMLSAIIGTLTVLTTFLLGRALGGRRVGWIAAVLLTFSSYHIHFSRLASNQIADPLIGTLAIWLLWRALAPTRRSAVEATSLWALSGVVAGVGWYAYFGARWVTFLIGLLVVWRALAEPRFLARHWRGLLMFAAGWLVVVLPLLGWYSVHTTSLTERYNAVSIFVSGWLEREVAITGKTAFQLLLQQLWKSAMAFHLTSDPTFWYYPQTPLVDFVTSALLLVGMAAALIRARWPSRTLALIWFWSTLVMAWVLTENPPGSQRGLLLLPVVVLFAGWGAEALWKLFVQYPRLAYVISTMLLGMMVVLNLGFYFGVYTPRRTYGNPTAEVATTFAHYVLAHPHPACASADPGLCDSVVYFFGPPTLYWEFGSIAFLLRDQPGANVQPGEMPEDVSSPARFVFVTARLGELAGVQSAYPGGVTTEVKASDQRVLMVVYDWAGEAAP